MNKQLGEQIGSSLGRVCEVEVDTDDTCWGSYLRIRVELDLTMSLIWGKHIQVRGANLWAPIAYEKLPKFCYKCAKILQSLECQTGNEDTGPYQFGLWLRTEQLKSRTSMGLGPPE